MFQAETIHQNKIQFCLYLAGTIRHNLDPFNQYDDEALWKALEKAHLKQKFSPLTPGSGAHQNDGSSKAKGLSTAVDSDGDNFSVGEKQLICLSR